MIKQRILVVEDDPAIRSGVRHSLRFNGYEVIEAEDSIQGLRMVREGKFDLLLLDLNLPDGDGLEILRDLRANSSVLPVIVLTARGEEGDRVKGLKLGADDYVVKPFGVSELLARIEAVLRRSPGRPADALLVERSEFTFDLGKRELRFADGTTVPLSELESDLLVYLMKNAGRAISRDEILARVWKLNPEVVTTRTVDMHIMHLRTKLRDNAAEPTLIRTLRGRGYLFSEAGA